MSKREVAALACRILALAALLFNRDPLVTWPAYIATGLWDTLRGGYLEELWFEYLLFGVIWMMYAAILIFLWVRADWIASKIVPHDSSRWPRFRAAELQIAAFSAIGLVTVMTSVRDFSTQLGIYLEAVFGPPGGPRVTFPEWLLLSETMGPLIMGALGMWLLLGSRGIVRFIHRLRRPEPHELIEDTRANRPVGQAGVEAE
jgi:hypothetical protein